MNVSQPARLTAIATAVLLLILCCAVNFALQSTLPPEPLGDSAPLNQFSAGRAMRTVRHIAAEPHPTGSQANIEVRDYLINELKSLGLTPEVQSALVMQQAKQSILQNRQVGGIHNVLAKLPGKQTGKALLLVAHYDSVPAGSGAADDAASVAAILETLRAIKTQAALHNDVICLFTDGEESGLLGANAFVRQHPWAKDVGLVLNFEYRGNSGAFMMFETSFGNGKLIEGLAAAVPAIQANSLMFEVYNRMPNDTDFTVFKQAGFSGMNFAAIDGFAAYHTELDRPEAINQGTLQHEGDIMLGLVKHFGNQSLDNLKAENRVYFDLPGFGIVHYPQSWITAMLLLPLIIYICICVKSIKTKAMRLRSLMAVAISYPLLIGMLYGINYGVLKGIQLVHTDKPNTFINDLFFIGLMLIDSAVMGSIVLVCRKWLTSQELCLGIAACWLIMNGLLCLIPGATFLTFWPILAVLLSYLCISLSNINGRNVNQKWLYAVGALPVLILYAPIIKNLYIALTFTSAAIILVPFCFAAGMFAPVLIEFRRSRSL
ncbi:MAG: M20/M25/M40 family metallo-hydrolase [Gammaproteobacteria bacterium]|nr:M20/M25/M40 family metallo-hydrolase [Gammaproteobacteria bacterium]